MSTSTPPDGPQPDHGSAEVLEQGSGGPIRPEGGVAGRRRTLVAAAGVAAVAVAGAGAWAAVSFFASGPQPAEALPATTLGYASIDLDPSGSQKVEAVRMLKKFPALDDELDLDTDDDLRELLFERLLDPCEDLSYTDDVEPWLGNRAALAAVDLGEAEPSVVAVVQVGDADAADQGLGALRECTGDSDSPGWVVEGEWAVLAETEALADRVVDATSEASLADDADYQKWTDEVGGAGLVNVYAAPEAGAHLADSLDGLMGVGGGFVPSELESAPPCALDSGMTQEEMQAAVDECTSSAPGLSAADPEVPAELEESLADFGGMALTLRFDDGGLELEYAGDGAPFGDDLPIAAGAGDVLATLPDDTAVAFGVGFADGWFSQVLEQVAAYSGAMSVEELVAEAERETGLDLPEDAEALAGEAAAFALGSDVDPETFVNSADGSDVPVGVKVRGDAEEVEAVLDKLRGQLADDDLELASASDGDMVAFGPNADYVADLVGDGGLGEVGAYRDLVEDADDAGAILFVNFDAGDWLTGLAQGLVGLPEDDPELVANLEPLEAFGISSWVEDDVAHAVVRLSTND